MKIPTCSSCQRPLYQHYKMLPCAPVQPSPRHTDETPVWDLVIADMRQRDHVGRAKYGTPLQASNGRDALRDAYEEALDLCVYLRQEIERRRQQA